MRKYNFSQAKEIIDSSEDLKAASIGMAEDWFWTAETVWENGEYTHDLTEDGLEIGGISGSSWATPSILLEFNNGDEKLISCHDDGDQGERPMFFSLGPLSVEAQCGLPALDK